MSETGVISSESDDETRSAEGSGVAEAVAVSSNSKAGEPKELREAKEAKDKEPKEPKEAKEKDVPAGRKSPKSKRVRFSELRMPQDSHAMAGGERRRVCPMRRR